MEAEAGRFPLRKSSDRPRFQAVGVVLLLLALLAWPAASQESTFITDVSQDVTAPMEVREFQEFQAFSYQCGTDTQGTTGETPFVRHLKQQRIEFKDLMTGTACGEIRWTFIPPPGADVMRVIFSADRKIEQNSTLNRQINSIQTVRLIDAGNVTRLETFIFDSGEATQPLQDFRFDFLIPTNRSTVGIGFYFEDRASRQVENQPANPGSQQTFTANVVRPTIVLPAVSRPVQVFSSSATIANNATGFFETTTIETVRLDGIGPPNATFSHQVVAARAQELTDFLGPDGSPIPAQDYSVFIEPTVVRIVLPSASYDRYGAGDYGLVFLALAAIPPPPPPPPPETIYPIIFAVMALAVLPGGLAVRGGFVFRAEATGRYRTSARTLLSTVGGLAVGFAAVVAVVFLTGIIAEMATLPITPFGWFLNALVFLFTPIFLALWIVPGRFVLRTMRDDIKARKKTQTELQRSNTELEHFAYVASHDLQEPLRTIAGFTQLLQRRYGDKLDEKGQKYIQRTVEGSERMQTLINDLLAFSRVQTKGSPFEWTELSEIMTGLVSDLETFFKQRKAKVNYGDMPRIRCDKSQIQQVFSNLIRNGIKYRHRKRRPVIAITAVKKGHEWEFAVQDNGAGIEKEYHERIFVIFQRLVARDAGGESGTGLGLAIVKKIVERHEGRIWVESEPGKGSTFRFTLPEEGPEL